MKIKSYLAEKGAQGFTLIELLVVIGILGILAAGLLAAIDPLEQIRKGNDANAKSAAVELAKASQRYFTTHNGYPWDAVVVGQAGAGCNVAAAPVGATSRAGSGAFLDCYNIVAGTGGFELNGELKSTFKSNGRLTRTDVNTIKVHQTPPPERRVVVCFQPESRSVKLSNETVYDTTGTLIGGGACPSVVTADGCHWCAQ